MNVGGLSEIPRNMARRVAAEGYYCAAPALYYRLGKIVIDPDSKDEKVWAIRWVAGGSLVNEKVMANTRSLLGFLEKEPVVRQGRIGCIGYCQGGRFSVLAGGTFPDQFKATASLFGTRLITDAADSSHLLLNRMQDEIYCGFAERDEHVPRSIAEQFMELLKSCPAKSTAEIHPGTVHGYAFPGRDVYHKEAAEKSWERIFAMFKRQIQVR